MSEAVAVPTILIFAFLATPALVVYWIVYDYVWDRWVEPAILRRILARQGLTEAEYERLTGRSIMGKR